jgi:hypothetical protein
MSGSNTLAADQGGDVAPERAEVEARAGRMGWQPREKYRGPANRWVDADEYVERGERMLPLLQERNRTLDRSVADLTRQNGEITQTLSTLVQTTRNAERVGYARAMRELKARRDKAIDEGDKAVVHAVEAEIVELGPEPPKEAPKPAPTSPAVDPAIVAWARRNPWFNSNRAAKGFAIAVLDDVQAENPGDTLAEQLDETEARVRERFPELFASTRARLANGADPNADPEPEPAPRRRAALVTPSNSAATRQAGPRSFDALPADAKREFERQKKALDGKGDPFTKEEYARYYFESEPE